MDELVAAEILKEVKEVLDDHNIDYWHTVR